jgi:CDP-2,3-bis-(O-geranylgeranyl)-sn-glycerol synthase
LEALISSPDLILTAVLSAFWIMLPAYVPNPVAAAAGGGRPIDLGHTAWDGMRVFGDGKTIRGLLIGVAAGVLVGAVQIWLQNIAAFGALPHHTPLSIFALATGALLGDLVKSFFKRRLGKDRGAAWPIADQYDLVAGALLLTLLLDPGWVAGAITLPVLIVILIITPLLHRGTNIIGYILGVKDVPW